MRPVLSFDPAKAFEEAFDDEIAQVEEETPNPLWASSGKPTKEYPNGEDRRWWRAHGPRMVSDWVKWREDSGWDVWTLPDGSPAIEVELMPEFGGITHRMIIDRLMVTPKKQLVVVDLKSGRTLPPGDMQLGFYRAGVLQVFGTAFDLGAYWDARKGVMTDLKRLDHYTPELLGAYAHRFLAARREGVFLPSITPFCKGCGMAKFCAAVGGSQAHMDPDQELMKGAR